MAVLYDGVGQLMLLKRSYESHNRNALAALADALRRNRGQVSYVAGLLHWYGGLPNIEPWAVAASSIVIPDFATARDQNWEACRSRLCLTKQ